MEVLARRIINTELNCNAMSNKQSLSLKERQQALRERRKKLGLVRLEVWVPEAEVKRVRQLARTLCQKAGEAINSP
jgi:hypothetical protein